MRNVTTAFRRTLTDINRKWLPYVDITLLDGTVLPQFTDATLWTSGLSFEDVVSEDEKFTALGAAIMGAATVVIDNTGEKWNDYDFNDADVTIRLGLEVNGAPEVLRIGQYTVAEAKYNGATVTLTLQDYMHQFDRAYDTALVYPATLGVILRDACTNCGVLYDNSLLEFTNNDYVVAEKPDGSNTTYRDVVAWVAQLAGCFAKFNATGKLEFKWFGDDILTAAQQGYDGGEFDPANPYATGDNANGGSFNPWNIGAELDGGALTDNGNCHYIGSLFSETIALDNTVITGVSVSAEREADNGRETVTATSGTTGYVIGIEGNKLLSADDVQTFATYLGTRVIGLTFRKSRVTHLSDPSIEAGDVALLYDHKSREYPILITRTRFTTGGRQETVCGSETPARNRAKQFSQETKNYVDLRRQLKKAQTAWNLAEASLRQQLQTASGLYKTEVEEPVGSGAYKTYYHDKAELEDSNIVMLFTDYGFTLTSDYQNGQNATWYGIGADGTGILDVLNTHGVNADWINVGVISDALNKNVWDLDNSTLSMEEGSIKLGRIGSTSNYNFAVNDQGEMDLRKGRIRLGSYTDATTGDTDWNFSVNDQGQVGIKSGSIEIGTKSSDHSTRYFRVGTTGAFEWDQQYSRMSDTGELTILKGAITLGDKVNTNYYFATDTNGKFEWKGTKSSLDSNGVFSAQGASLEGTLTTEDGLYKTVIEDGFVKHYHDDHYFGKVGSSIFTQNKKGMMFDIGYDADYGGFAVQESANQDASLAFWYDRTGDQFISAKDIYMQSNTLITASIEGNQQLNLKASQFNFNKKSGSSGNVIVEGKIYMNTSDQVATMSDLSSHIADMNNNVLPQYATRQWVGQQGYLTSSSLSNYYTKTEIDNEGFLTYSSLSQGGGYSAFTEAYGTATTIVELQDVKWDYNGRFTGFTGTLPVAVSQTAYRNVTFVRGIVNTVSEAMAW